MFGDFNLNKELDTLLKRNNVSITADQYMSITDIYETVTKEQVRQYSNYTDRVKLLEGILQQTDQGKDATDILQAFSDVRHFEFYERFMGTEERRRLVNTLKEKGVPLDVLKGVKVTKGGDKIMPYPNVEISYSFEEDKDASISLSYFEITVDDETIFDFDNGIGTELEEEIERDVWREVSGVSSLYGGRITNTDIGDVKMWKDKNGRTFYTDSKGHRVKVKDGVVQERVIWDEEL